MPRATRTQDLLDGRRTAVSLGTDAGTPRRRADPRWTALNVDRADFAADSDVVTPLPRAAIEAFTGDDDEPPRYIVYLPVVAPDLTAALDLAASLARSLTFLPQIEVGDTTVSAEGRPDVRRRVFCDRLLPGRRRCARRAGHDGPCSADG